MIDIEETPDGLRAIDVAKNEMEVELDGWESGGNEFDIDRRVHLVTSGSAKQVRLPLSAVTVEENEGSSWHFALTDELTTVPDSEHLVQIENSMTMFIRANSEFEVQQDYEGDETTITFPERTELTLGFRSYEKVPDDQIRIPPTPEGLASALTAMGQYHETDLPDRSYPSMRLHPPLVEVNEAADPHEPRFDSEPSVRIELPRSLEDLFVVAPLAYYLSAEVTATDVANPSIVTDSEQIRRPTGVSVSEWVESLLKRVFYLDCLVRNAGPYAIELTEMALLDEISIEAEQVYELPVGRRLIEYMDIYYDGIADGFPKWPLSVFVESSISNISTIPHLLNKLALIHPPESEVLNQEEFITCSLDDFQRSRGVTSAESEINQPVLHRPRDHHSTSQAWIADGAVIDGFKCSPHSFSNSITRRDDSPDEISVSVILNERDMRAELADVVDAYRQRGEELPLSIEAYSDLTRMELRDVLETAHDYVHYIGHCDDEGLRCADGYLNVERLHENRVRMFFLNACGSYQQGLSLIRTGSIAGTVTTGDVIDGQARKVGAALAKLLTLGFSLDLSVRLARRMSIMNRQYLVLGNGTESLTQGQWRQPLILTLERSGDGVYSVRYQLDGFDFHGGLFKAIHGSGSVLFGNPDETKITEDSLYELLKGHQEPVIYEDNLYWPDELLDELF